MRARNLKINVYLNESEKKMLKEKSNKAGLSQSEFIRNVIMQSDNEDTTVITNSLSKIIDYLYMLKKQMDFLRYSDYSEFITKQIQNINGIRKKLQN